MISLPPERLKQILLQTGVVSAEAFDAAAEEATRRDQNPIDVLISRGILSEDYFYRVLGKALNVESVRLTEVSMDENVLRLIPDAIARARRVILFGKNADGSYNAAMENPTDLETINFLALRLGAPVHPYLATDRDLNRGYSRYGAKETQDFKEIIEEQIRESLRSQARGVEEAAQEVPIVAIVDNLIRYGLSSRASDIHFDVLETEVLVRFRVDGVLREIISLPKSVHSAVVARIKILSGLRIDEHARPQDGRFKYAVADREVDVRVSVLPTFYGEKPELRLLDAAQKPLSFEELGMFDDAKAALREGISKSYGMVLVCGPTGSGKTTTLYSVMNVLNRPEVNIVTVEDPIEYDMKFVNQVQVNPVAGITFASGLRSILRQDPDIMMVGEIRDADTAGIAVQSALTGHLVLSSLHTNDSPTAVPRLMDMQVKPFLVSAVLNVILSQRLVRRIHVGCIESYEPDEKEIMSIRNQIREIGMDPDEIKLPKRLYRGKGCDTDNGTGYEGRVALFEAMAMSEEIRKFIIDPGFSLDGLRRLARKGGMVTMFEDGLRKAELGLTTLEEIFRVVRE
ncbi:hypothetical protein A2110_02070 [Candidatus Jorgensenbacteria bacterium GWA1_54_12]|uniref:Bacterial type II secretion system protein E domain-containing protein n=1 Tax=Candidatus Jorgensenbacteria bacterium GWA1_54_12 TaxID=1798468 RepID=A0A1F6BLG7_9BACT|nr:MAG: hypothetical protein A2110_02070 [Candidatus Jorgensenbacteria bacterium GWA1_54_12]